VNGEFDCMLALVGLRWCQRSVPDSASHCCAAPAWHFELARDELLGRLEGMSIDNELQKHYVLLLGIGSPWEVKAVALKLAEKQVDIELGWQWGAAAKCPECGRECSIHDSAPERTWQHLDTMQYETLIRARVPRCDCPEHGVKTMKVLWAAPQGRFTLLFERIAVDVLLACASVSQACELLGLGWEAAHEIMRRAVKRGLERRELDQLKYLGMDEKSFKRGHSYITLLSDLEQSRILDVVEERTAPAAVRLFRIVAIEWLQRYFITKSYQNTIASDNG